MPFDKAVQDADFQTRGLNLVVESEGFGGWCVCSSIADISDETMIAWGRYKDGESYPEKMHVPFFASKPCKMVNRARFDSDGIR